MPRRASLMRAPKGRKTSTQGKVMVSTANESPSPAAPEQSEIPEGWQQASLGELCELLSEQVQPSEASGLHYVGLEHIDTGEPTLRRWGEPDEVRSAKNCFAPGDILYGKLRPYLDKAVIASFKGICSTDILVFRTRTGRADAEFLVSALHTNPFVQHAITTTAGVNHPRTSWGALKTFRMVVPPLAEQQAIAEVLRTVQRAKEATEKVIAATRQLKASLMKHLFTYGPVPFDQADHVPLKETEIGPMPEHWEVSRLADLCEKPEYGLTATAQHQPGGPGFLRITDIQGGTVNWATVPFCECPEQEFARLALKEGDLLVARIGATTGKTFLVKEARDAVFASYLIRIRTRRGLAPDFLFGFTNTQLYWQQINAAKSGRLKQGINIPVLQGLLCPEPPEAEQRQITAQLAAVDAKLAAGERQREALDTLFRSLLHHLMTGKVRVKDVGVHHEA